MRTIRCLADLRCLRQSALDQPLLNALEDDFRKQRASLRFEESEEEFSLIEHGYIVLLEKDDNLRDLREVGLCPMKNGLYGTNPEFIETHDIGGKRYFKINVLYTNDYMMQFYLAQDNDPEATAWAESLAA
jgi:hypothetical protein